jgi:hypothetical protein
MTTSSRKRAVLSRKALVILGCPGSFGTGGGGVSTVETNTTCKDIQRRNDYQYSTGEFRNAVNGGRVPISNSGEFQDVVREGFNVVRCSGSDNPAASCFKGVTELDDMVLQSVGSTPGSSSLFPITGETKLLLAPRVGSCLPSPSSTAKAPLYGIIVRIPVSLQTLKMVACQDLDLEPKTVLDTELVMVRLPRSTTPMLDKWRTEEVDANVTTRHSPSTLRVRGGITLLPPPPLCLHIPCHGNPVARSRSRPQPPLVVPCDLCDVFQYARVQLAEFV